MDHSRGKTKPNHENTFKAPASISLDKVSPMAKFNINGAKKYTPATLGRVTKKPHDTDISSHCSVTRSVTPLQNRTKSKTGQNFQ